MVMYRAMMISMKAIKMRMMMMATAVMLAILLLCIFPAGAAVDDNISDPSIVSPVLPSDEVVAAAAAVATAAASVEATAETVVEEVPKTKSSSGDDDTSSSGNSGGSGGMMIDHNNGTAGIHDDNSDNDDEKEQQHKECRFSPDWSEVICSTPNTDGSDERGDGSSESSNEFEDDDEDEDEDSEDDTVEQQCKLSPDGSYVICTPLPDQDEDQSEVGEDDNIPTAPYYPADDYDDIGVRQLFDPSLMTIEEFFDELNYSVGHILHHQGAIDEETGEIISEGTEYQEASHLCRFKKHDCILRYKLMGSSCSDKYSLTNAKDSYDMAMDCCPVCDGIPDLHYYHTCPIDPDVYNPFTKPGQVTETFVAMLRRLRDAGIPYEVHATPFHGIAPDDIPPNIQELIIEPSSHTIGTQFGPWIVTIDNYTDSVPADALIEHGEKMVYERSMDGVSYPDGSWGLEYVDFRTSRETYCWESPCVDDPTIVDLMTNITTTVGIPLPNCYFLQLLKYHVGELYKEHQDYHTHQANAQSGARVVTWYMYLSDVEAGGETQFPRIRPMPVRVQPKKGRVLVWSNIRDDDPREEDLLARHEALPVIKGIKYGATAWFHHRNIREIPGECHN